MARPLMSRGIDPAQRSGSVTVGPRVRAKGGARGSLRAVLPIKDNGSFASLLSAYTRSDHNTQRGPSDNEDKERE